MTSLFYKITILLVSFFTLGITDINAQNLKIEKGESNRIYRETRVGHALVLFESTIDNLTIESSIRDTSWTDIRNGRKLYFIEANVTQDSIFFIPNERTYSIRGDNTKEYILTIEDMMPKNVYYYTVTLQEQIPAIGSVEYLLSKDSKKGVRVSFGRRIGGYVSYQWGQYRPSGINIDEATMDADLRYAKCLGYIRTSINAGLRVCVNYKYIPTYIYLGGGYGEYGRQWDNTTFIEGSPFFYSDYIRGGNIEAGITVLLPIWPIDWLIPSLSAGADAVLNRSRISIDYQIGLGLNLVFDSLKK